MPVKCENCGERITSDNKRVGGDFCEECANEDMAWDGDVSD